KISVDKSLRDWIGILPEQENTATVSEGEYIWNDAADDDTGDGDYTYPTDRALKRGADLREFRVTYDKDNLYLMIKCDRPGDWWAPYRLVGIDQDGAKGGRGGTEVLIQGDMDELSSDSGSFGELRVSPELACEYVIGISSTYKGRIWDANGELVARREGEADDTPGFKVDDSNWFAVEVAIPLKLIGGSPEGQTWRFIVATSQQDYDVAREIEEASSEWHGGGGEESDLDGVDPDYYDLASPDKEVQEKELNSYRAGADPGDTDAFATINESYLIVNFGGYVPM
ncbi:MAG: hypothetical protein AMJ78_02270, partial [Omnitrophica WOR_2 bacterium SM23_29]